MAAVALAMAPPVCAGAQIHGMPFARTYPFEEIGDIPRGVHLGFDPFGRLAVIQEGVYSVLIDTTWVDMIDPDAARRVSMATIIQAGDRRLYYGGRSSWGLAVPGPNGRLRPVPLVPPDRPAWTAASSFNSVVSTPEGVYFAGGNGVIYWDFRARRNMFFEHPGIAALFQTGTKVYVSGYGQPIAWIDVAKRRFEPIPDTSFDGVAVGATARLDDGRSLLQVRDGRLVVFDGRTVSAWAPQAELGLTGTIVGLQRLVKGGMAVAIAEKGLFLVSASGRLELSLTLPRFQRITAMASRERGVLWVATDDAVEKVLFRSALTAFGQQLGLNASWPKIANWNGRVVVASLGHLFRAEKAAPGCPTRFESVHPLPPSGAWVIAAQGARMLVGNATGVFAARTDGTFDRVLHLGDIGNLLMPDDSHCYVIGRRQIALLRYADGRWRESGPRIAGVGDSSEGCVTRRAAWIELGANRVARLAPHDGRLSLRLIVLPWKDTRWVNVGNIDDTVVLSGATNGRMFFDDRTGQFCRAPDLARLLARSRFWITRVTKDDTGRIWATHRHGVVTFTPRNGDYAIDESTFGLVNDHYPTVNFLHHGDVWLTAARSLYHVEHLGPSVPSVPLRPILVSITNTRRNVSLLSRFGPDAGGLRLSADENNLRFRFFSGGYAWNRAPGYDYRLSDSERWTKVDESSTLQFPGLRDGAYHLQVRFAGEARGLMTIVPFVIAPPWYRTSAALAGYGIGSVFLVLGLVRWSGVRVRRRSVMLEQLVHERTRCLETTMDKLNDETRYAATLAERNRLAGEIHDSMQQGLSGVILQLDATLRLSTVSDDVRSRLDVVRKMVSFTREDVQHAVWDMESPLLENADLGGALRKLAEFVSGGVFTVDVDVIGEPRDLLPAAKHHVLRIAQEAMTNAVRHAKPKRIAVSLEYGPDSVTLTVVDDGIGFDPDDVLRRRIGHFGLRGLRGRARKLSAQVVIRSAPGDGATIRVTVPTDPAPQNLHHAHASAREDQDPAG